MRKNDIFDNALIAAVKNGDTRAFKGLVEKYESQVTATVVGILGICPEAEETGQDTFVRFYNSLAAFRGDASVGTFLTRIAINLSLNEIKRRKKKKGIYNEGIDLEQIPDTNPDPERDMNAERIRDAVLLLEPKMRGVVVLRLVQGYTMKETSEILKLPLGTVLSRLFRAQKLLRIMLDKKRGGQYG
jgi:RNA polymerase sigma-70 factor (ECF subfamily)